ncbi:unnamed protein product [Paramecium pentaurelia]|uniref:Uncharacterized protein n=1 Tax=Paramecium pentaurelia TaxID=43138 RepID=A0A8S1XZ94_9CILI|nr:unnamed protein product [Paramecium pentaurelia]CAD8205494.1 unnamed protein product [Paramecium pentaurelia]
MNKKFNLIFQKYFEISHSYSDVTDLNRKGILFKYLINFQMILKRLYKGQSRLRLLHSQ